MEGKELELSSISIRLSQARGLIEAGRRDVVAVGRRLMLDPLDDEVGPVISNLSEIAVALDKVDEMIEAAQGPIRAALARLYSEGTRAAVLASVAEIRP